MAEQVLTRNVDRAFAIFDVNGDGRIQWSDFEAKAGDLGRGFGVEPHSSEVRDLVAAYERIWEYVCGAADVDRDGIVTKVEFERAHVAERLSTETLADLWTVVSDRIFDLVDRDVDGDIDHDELLALYRVGRVPDAEHAAEVAFAAMDADGDGRVDRAEFTANVRGLFTAADGAAKGATMLGD